jgi:endonuclease/exonuclease/phosphatase family metal-dependent hydrolase
MSRFLARFPAAVLLLCLLATACRSPAPHGPQASAATALDVIVMTFNIRWDGFDDGANSWEHRRDLAAGVIRSSGADVIGVQEASPAQVRDLLDRLPGFRAFDAGDRSDVVPILYRADRFRLDKAGGFWLVESSALSGGTRKCTWVRLVERSTGLAFRQLNFHLDHRSLPSREQSVVEVSRHLAELDSADPFVVTGDFNTGEDSPPMQFLRGEISLVGRDGSPVWNPVPLVDTFRLLHPGEEEVCTAGDDFLGGRRGEMIDHVLVPRQVRVLAAEIRHDERDGHYPSDHFPVTAQVVFAYR